MEERKDSWDHAKNGMGGRHGETSKEIIITQSLGVREIIISG
jgi:hypothetical protein